MTTLEIGQLLNDEVYSAMWLRYAEDMSINDIARAMDKSSSWAKVTLMRARERLAADFDADGVGIHQEERYG